MENKKDNQPFLYTEEQLMARLKFFIGVCLALTLTGIVFVVLYSLIFVTQPLNAISPIDQKFFELIVPIATFLTGTLSGIMLVGNKKEDQEAMLAAQKNAQTAADSAKSSPKTDSFNAGKTAFGATSWNSPMQQPTAGWGNQSFGQSSSMFTAPVMTTAGGKKIVPDEEQPLL